MRRADLHVHSHYSAHPSEWFLQRMGTRESYTTPQAIYNVCRERGMDFVTVTDHNCMRASLELKDKYPDTVITGVEVTTYFPSDRCKIHVLLWGLDEKQFAEVDSLRTNIFVLRDFIRQEQLAYAVAHATFSINRCMTLEHFEQLVLLFDCFEGINGSRGVRGNAVLMDALAELTPVTIENLRLKHRIEPFSEEPWRKGITGGSDDHGGLFVARTWTQVSDQARTPEAFLDALRNRTSNACGRHNDYRGFALSLYKIAWDFSRAQSTALGTSFMSTLNRILFENGSSDFRSRFAIRRMQRSKKGNSRDLALLLGEMIREFEQMQGLDIEQKLDRVYDSIGKVMDEMLRQGAGRLSRSLTEADLAGIVRHFSGLIPAAFITVPFFTTIKVLHEARDVLDGIEQRYSSHAGLRKKRWLWFTDTLTDLNGVSETIRKLAWLCHERGIPLSVVTCKGPDDAAFNLSPNVASLPTVVEWTPSFFATFTLKVPSVLALLRTVCEFEPDAVIVSTPGPVGMLGILMAKLLGVPCSGVYHTDFGAYASKIAGDDGIARLAEEGIRALYANCREVYVPTFEYMRILETRGYERSRMKRFRRGIDGNLFVPIPGARESLEKKYGIRPGVTLVYAGRISHEKNIDQLVRLYRRLFAGHPDLNLLLCGDGPAMAQVRESCRGLERVHFPGRVPREELPLVYSGSDCMVFPSTTDTFGMVVLEAQSCGLPVAVSDRGGPQEIVLDAKTGHVIAADNDDAWVKKLSEIIDMVKHFPERHFEMRYAAREMVQRAYQWDMVLADLFGERRTLPVKTPMPACPDHTQAALAGA